MLQNAIDIVQTLALIISLIYVAIQARQMSSSLQEMRNEMKLQVILSIRDCHQQINDILLQNDQLRNKFGWNLDQIFAFKLFIDFEKIYLHRLVGYIDDEYWAVQYNLIRNTMTLPWIKEFWEEYHRRNEYHPKFVEFMNGILSSPIASNHMSGKATARSTC